MTIKITMPALSPTMTEGTLSKWLVKEGDQVKAGDILAEIETDKATMEVEAVDEGKVTKILVDEGSTAVKVNSTIAILDGTDFIVDVVNDKGQVYETNYSEEGQKVFDQAYDMYCDIIESTKQKPAFTIPFG